MANVLDLLHPIAQPSMNGFDLSQKHVYGGAVGRVDSPVQIETVPRDKFKINLGSLMRTMTPETAPFLRGKVTYDFYFVPYSQLWHPFNQFVDQRLDVHSSIQKGCARVPVIHLKKLFELIKLVYDYQANNTYDEGSPIYLKDIHGVSWYANIWNLLDFFGYGNYLHIKEAIEDVSLTESDWADIIAPYDGKYVNVFRPAAYQHIWYDYYRNKFFDNYELDNNYNPYVNDYVLSFNFDDIDCSTFANSIIPIDATDIQASCNKRIFMLFTQRYCQYKQDLIQSALPSQQFGAVSEVSIDVSSMSLSGFTGSPSYPDPDGYYTQVKNAALLNPDVDPSEFGVDSGVLMDFHDDSYLQLRTPHTHSISGLTVSGQTGSFDVLALKRAEALQKWRQNALRAGNMVDDSFRSHFGVTPRYESDNNALKLGSFEGAINVNTVETTAQSSGTGNTKVGNLGSNVLATISGKEIQFSNSDYGVIVCMQYFRPESEYSSTMIDRANILSEPFDFFTPEFCNIGLDSINLADYNANVENSQDLTTPLGFASQYWWYKSALDKCHGQFAKFQFYDCQLSSNSIFKGDSVMWCAPRLLDLLQTQSGTIFRNKSSLYVSPNLLDDVFGVHYYDRTRTDIEYFNIYNQLIFNTYFDIKAIRPMSVVGLPNF